MPRGSGGMWRRSVETTSPYARQFLDRMDKPHVSRIERVPPAIAIDLAHPVRSCIGPLGDVTLPSGTRHARLDMTEAIHTMYV